VYCAVLSLLVCLLFETVLLILRDYVRNQASDKNFRGKSLPSLFTFEKEMVRAWLYQAKVMGYELCVMGYEL
jgi:hypothetical protein